MKDPKPEGVLPPFSSARILSTGKPYNQISQNRVSTLEDESGLKGPLTGDTSTPRKLGSRNGQLQLTFGKPISSISGPFFPQMSPQHQKSPSRPTNMAALMFKNSSDGTHSQFESGLHSPHFQGFGGHPAAHLAFKGYQNSQSQRALPMMLSQNSLVWSAQQPGRRQSMKPQDTSGRERESQRIRKKRVKQWAIPDWAEMSIIVHITLYLLFIFGIFIFMQTFYLYKAAYQFQSTMENKLGEQLSRAVAQQYQDVANSTIIQTNLFFSVFAQLISKQSILLSHVLDPNSFFLNDQEEEIDQFFLLSPSLSEITNADQLASVKRLQSIRELASIETSFFKSSLAADMKSSSSGMMKDLLIENCLVYLPPTGDNGTAIIVSMLEDSNYHTGRLINQTSIEELYERVAADGHQAFIDLDLHHQSTGAITFAEPIYQDYQNKVEGVIGVLLWEMDFKKTLDVIVVPPSFFNQLFSRIEIRLPFQQTPDDYIRPLSSSINTTALDLGELPGEFSTEQTGSEPGDDEEANRFAEKKHMGELLFNLTATQNKVEVLAVLEMKAFERSLLETQYSLIRSNESVSALEHLELHSSHTMPDESKPSTFFLAVYADFIFKDLLNNIYDVDFTEQIKTIETKEKEIIFYDSNNFTAYSRSIFGQYDPELVQAIDEVELAEEMKMQVFIKEKGEQAKDQPPESEDPLEDNAGRQLQEEKPSAAEAPGDKKAASAAVTSLLGPDPGLASPTAALPSSPRLAQGKKELNFIITLVGEKLRKETPYYLSLYRFLDSNMKFFFNFMVGFVLVSTMIVGWVIISLIQNQVIIPIQELTNFINENRETSSSTMSEFLKRIGSKQRREERIQEHMNQRNSFNSARARRFSIIRQWKQPQFKTKDDLQKNKKNINEVAELRIHFARFFLQSSRFLKKASQLSQQERISFMSDPSGMNLVNSAFQSKFFSITKVTEKFMANAGILPRYEQAIAEHRQKKLKAVFVEKQYSLSYGKGSDIGTPRGFTRDSAAYRTTGAFDDNRASSVRNTPRLKKSDSRLEITKMADRATLAVVASQRQGLPSAELHRDDDSGDEHSPRELDQLLARQRLKSNDEEVEYVDNPEGAYGNRLASACEQSQQQPQVDEEEERRLEMMFYSGKSFRGDTFCGNNPKNGKSMYSSQAGGNSVRGQSLYSSQNTEEQPIFLKQNQFLRAAQIPSEQRGSLPSSAYEVNAGNVRVGSQASSGESIQHISAMALGLHIEDQSMIGGHRGSRKTEKPRMNEQIAEEPDQISDL